MILNYSPIIPEIESIINVSSTYINKKGEHPLIGTIIDPNMIKNKELMSEEEWAISIDNPLLFEKMKQQIITCKLYKENILIIS